MDGFTRRSLRGSLTSHCLLLEFDRSLALVDTGYGLGDVAAPRSRLDPLFLELLKPSLREEMTAVRQIERLGFDAGDVRHIVLSHLDFDHAGGLDDFPHATVHLLASEINAALSQRTRLDRMRYRPQQWHTQAMWRGYDPNAGEDWLGFSGAQAIPELASDVLLIPLLGHTLGHAGIAIRRPAGWLLYAADAYFYHRELDRDRVRCTPGLRLYQTMMEKNRTLRLQNRERLRALRHSRSDVSVFCAHDVHEFELLSGRSFSQPAVALPHALVSV